MSASTRAAAVEREAIQCEPGGLSRYLRRPVDILRAYRRQDFAPDLLAALTVAAVAIPQAIAYASIAELPPHYGLYTAGVAAIVGSLWGCSRFLATGPVNASSLLVLPVLLAVATPGTPDFLLAASTLAVLVGIFKGVLGLLRFGMLVFAPWASHIPRAAIAGVLLAVAWRMVDREGIRRVIRTSRSETAVMAITFAATMALPRR